MNITKKNFWVVRNPGPNSTFGDICWSTSLERFYPYVLGTGLVDYERENHTFYDNEEEARKDAEARLAVSKERDRKRRELSGAVLPDIGD